MYDIEEPAVDVAANADTCSVEHLSGEALWRKYS